MKKNLLFICLLVVAVLIGCSPSQTCSGTYNLTSFSATGVPVASGTSGSATISANGDNKVNILVSTGGNPDFYVTGVGAMIVSIPGAKTVTFTQSGDFDVSGSYVEAGTSKTIAVDIVNNVDTTSISIAAVQI